MSGLISPLLVSRCQHHEHQAPGTNLAAACAPQPALCAPGPPLEVVAALLFAHRDGGALCRRRHAGALAQVHRCCWHQSCMRHESCCGAWGGRCALQASPETAEPGDGPRTEWPWSDAQVAERYRHLEASG